MPGSFFIRCRELQFNASVRYNLLTTYFFDTVRQLQKANQ